MTNREIAELMFEKMKFFGFTPYDIDYGNGYFLFDMGDNSVVHFRIKEVWKNWKFGMWIDSEALNKDEDIPYEKEPNVVQVFCQHEHLIDKFNPSRSSLRVEFKPSDFSDGVLEFGAYRLRDMLKMIKHHPFICWNEFCGDYAGYYSDKSFLLPFIKYESEYLNGEIAKEVKTVFWLNYTKTKLSLMKKFSKILYDVELYDFEKENEEWSTDYLYKIKLTFNDVDTDKILDFFDFISNSVLMTVVAFLTCIFVGYIVKPDMFVEEIELTGKFKRKKLFLIVIKYFAPICIVLILISSVLDALGIVKI